MNAPTLTRWIGETAWRHRRGIGILALLLTLQAVVQAALPWPMKVLVDHVLKDVPAPPWLSTITSHIPGADSPLGLLAWSIAATVLLFAAATLISMLHAVMGVSIGQRMVYSTAGDLFAKLQRLSLGFHARRSVGDSMKRITGDCSAVAVIIRDAALPALAAVVSIVIMFSIMVMLNPLLALVAALALPLLVIIIRRLTPPVIERGYEYAQSEAEVWDIAQRTLAAVPVIQAFSAEGAADDQIRRTYDGVYTRVLALTWAQFRLKISGGLVMAAGTAAILLAGAHEVLADRLTVGELLVFMAYLAALYAPLDALVYAAGSATESAGAARRILHLLAEREEVSDSPNAQNLHLAAPPSIALEGVSYAYEPARPALRDVSLQVPPGATLALVGSSGAGKTTIAGLIPRLFDPQQGRVLLNGQDIRAWTCRSLREHIAILAQDTYLFPVSIAENIAYARPDADPADIKAAAQAAGADEFVSRLAEGYDTIVGQRGATLSVGERQRIALARAFLKDAPILILDEPTSALDAASESVLLESLERLRRGRTTILIAHRLSAIRHADLIVVVEDGRIVERGSHQELMDKGGRYSHLLALHQGRRPMEPPT